MFRRRNVLSTKCLSTKICRQNASTKVSLDERHRIQLLYVPSYQRNLSQVFIRMSKTYFSGCFIYQWSVRWLQTICKEDTQVYALLVLSHSYLSRKEKDSCYTIYLRFTIRCISWKSRLIIKNEKRFLFEQ